MCNLYRMEKGPDAVAAVARAMGRQLSFPEGAPNFAPGDIRITDRAPVLRAGREGSAELVARRWSWPGPGGKPLFNLRSEKWQFPLEQRCVALADAFYEHTAPADPKAKRKDRWAFSWPAHEWFGIAAIWRADPAVGEAFSLLTCEPGPDVAPYHGRQVIMLSPADCFAWLDGSIDVACAAAPKAAGSLAVAGA